MSGGVDFLIKNLILSAFYVNVLDTSHEGIIVIKLTHKESKTTIVVCGCYLPTRNLSRLIKLGGIRVVRKHGTRCAVRKESGLEFRETGST